MLTKYAEATVLDVIEVPKNAGRQRLARVRRQAHRHHFDFTPKRGYIYVRSRAISSRCNDNFDEFPAAEIKAAYRSFVGKPVFVNHANADHRRARGVIIDAALHEDTNPDGSPDTWAEVLMEVDAVRFPMLAKAVLAGDIARTSMGTDVAYSICTACGNRAETPADYCAHIPKMKGMKIHRTLASGAKEEVLVAERCHGLSFFENSLLVEDPADPTAHVLDVVDGNATTAAKEPEPVQKAATLNETDHDPLREVEAGWTEFLDFLRGGRDERNQCPECGKTFVWSPAVHRFVCPAGHATSPAYAAKIAAKDEVLWMTSTGWIHADKACAESRRNSQGATRAPEGALSMAWAKPCKRCLADASTTTANLSTEGFGHDIRDLERSMEHPEYKAPAPPKPAQPVKPAEPEGEMFHLNPDKTAPGYGGGGAQHLRDIDAENEKHWERERRRNQRAQTQTASRHEAYGETKAPAQVDTMRAENCPVCGDDEAFNGERCSVCGYQQPPEQFRDPDLSKAKEMDLRGDQQEADAQQQPMADQTDGTYPEADELECTNCGEVFSAEGDDDQAGTTPPEADASARPDAPAADAPDREDEEDDSDDEDSPDDLNDLAEKSDDELDEDLLDEEDAEEDEPSDEEDLATDEDEEDPTEDPSELEEDADVPSPEGAEDDLSDLPVVVNMTCPVCGKGTLVPKQSTDEDNPSEPEINEVGKVPVSVTSKGTSRAMTTPNPAKQARNRIITALRNQQARIAQQDKEILSLKEALYSLASAAGVANHPKFAALRSTADGGNDPDGSPATTTEEAKTPQATDDVENVGAGPAAANESVTPKAVTDVQSTDVAVASEPLLDNLQDVTAPVGGTDSAPKGEAAHVETEIRVDQPNNDVMDPKGSTGWTNAAAHQQRFVACVRLARLRAQAGLDAEVEDMVAAQRIAESKMSLAEIEAEARGLSTAVAAKAAQPAPRHLVPRSAGIQPRPSLAPTTATNGAESEEFMFGFDPSS